MAAPLISMQTAAKAHAQHSKDAPEWMSLALVAINKWGRQEYTLAHAVALALEDAYERGRRGDYPEVADRVVKEVASTVIKRRSRT